MKLVPPALAIVPAEGKRTAGEIQREEGAEAMIGAERGKQRNNRSWR